MNLEEKLLAIGRRLADEVDGLRFQDPVACVYNPLKYAWDLHSQYLTRFGARTGRVLLLGMNPGPFGMAQTGVPFGEVRAVRDFLGIRGEVGRPAVEHPKRPVWGLDCPRSEVSGRRVWGWAEEAFGTADAFFERFFVVNYCPLVFMEASGRNRVPEKLPAAERKALYEACDRAFLDTVEVLRPEWIVGIGSFAEGRAKTLLQGMDVPIGRVLHPSPASPRANRGWQEAAEAELEALGIAARGLPS